MRVHRLRSLMACSAAHLVHGLVRGQPLLQGSLVNADMTAEANARQAIVAHHPVHPLWLDLERVSGFFNCHYLYEDFPFCLRIPQWGGGVP